MKLKGGMCSTNTTHWLVSSYGRESDMIKIKIFIGFPLVEGHCTPMPPNKPVPERPDFPTSGRIVVQKAVSGSIKRSVTVWPPSCTSRTSTSWGSHPTNGRARHQVLLALDEHTAHSKEDAGAAIESTDRREMAKLHPPSHHDVGFNVNRCTPAT